MQYQEYVKIGCGIKGDEINILLAAAAFNFKRMMNKWKQSILGFFQNGVLQLLYFFKTLFTNLFLMKLGF